MKLKAALADLPGARVVNIGDELGTMYSRYLHEAMLQALAELLLSGDALDERTARELLEKLQAEQPADYPDGLLRTLQRL